MRRSAEKIRWEDLLRRSAEKICWEDLLRKSAERKSAEKICWEDVLKKICCEDLLRRSAAKICWEDLLRENLLRRSAERICWEDLLKKICWEDLLRRSAEKICWEDLLRMVVDQDFFKISFFFLRRVGLVDQDGRPPSRHFVLIGRPKLWWNASFWDRRATLSSFRAHRTSKTVVKCEFLRSPRNPLVVSCSSDVQNCGEMRIFEIAAQPSRHFVVVGRPKLRWNAIFLDRRRNLSSLRARRTSKTEVKCESAWVVGQPSRRFVLIGRPKLRWNANFEARSATLSSLRAGQMSETVVKWWFLYAACYPGLPALDSYIFAYAAVVKRGFWNVEWHAVVARRTFCFCWMNPLVGFGGSMARNCGETQIFFWNCRKHRAKRSFWKLCSRKFEGSLARNVRFGSLFCEISRKPRTKRSFWKHCSMKFGGSLARNARFGSLFSENWRRPRTKRSFWQLVLWNFEEASHETIVLEAFSVKIAGSIVRNARFGSLFCEISRKPRATRSFWKLVLWNLGEASHETLKRLFWKLGSMKFRGSFARNVRLGSLFCECFFVCVFSLCFLSVCFLSAFSVGVFSLCVFSVCVFCLCVFCLCVFSVFSVCVFLSVCFLSLCFLSVCFLSVFSICVFFVCVFSLCFLSVFSLCGFSLSVFSLCVFSVCVFYLRVFCLCVFSVFSLCVFSLCVFSLRFLFVFFSVCVFSLSVFSVCVFSVFSLCVLSLCFNLWNLFLVANDQPLATANDKTIADHQPQTTANDKIAQNARFGRWNLVLVAHVIKQ